LAKPQIQTPIAPKSIIDFIVKNFSLFYFLLSFLLSIGARAQSPDAQLSLADTTAINQYEEKDFIGVADTVEVTERPFNKATLDSLKNSDDFNYKQPPTIAESLWDRLMRWIGEFFRVLFEGATYTGMGRLLMYLIGLILFSALIMMLLKVDAFKVFYSGADARNNQAKFFEENIHEMDFEKLIGEASQKKDYRQGTRLILLYALKLLADKSLIDWQAGKTNHDYVQELKTGEIKTGLNELSFYFDYAWYGNFSINQDTFQKVENSFTDWRKKI
jgi:Domain of unknown function (DUF4129)